MDLADPKNLYAAATLATAAASALTDPGLVDHPIAASSVKYLNGQWAASTTVMHPRAADCTWERNTDYNQP